MAESYEDAVCGYIVRIELWDDFTTNGKRFSARASCPFNVLSRCKDTFGTENHSTARSAKLAIKNKLRAYLRGSHGAK